MLSKEKLQREIFLNRKLPFYISQAKVVDQLPNSSIFRIKSKYLQTKYHNIELPGKPLII